MNTVGDIGGNTIVLSYTVHVDGALLFKLFPKTIRKQIVFKVRKGIHVSGHIHFKPTLFFRVSSGYLNLKLL